MPSRETTVWLPLSVKPSFFLRSAKVVPRASLLLSLMASAERVTATPAFTPTGPITLGACTKASPLRPPA